MIKPYEITSLPIGFLVVTYDPVKVDPENIRIDSNTWEDLKEKGYTGGIILRKGTKLQSLSDEELAKVGLQRIVE